MVCLSWVTSGPHRPLWMILTSPLTVSSKRLGLGCSCLLLRKCHHAEGEGGGREGERSLRSVTPKANKDACKEKPCSPRHPFWSRSGGSGYRGPRVRIAFGLTTNCWRHGCLFACSCSPPYYQTRAARRTRSEVERASHRWC